MIKACSTLFRTRDDQGNRGHLWEETRMFIPEIKEAYAHLGRDKMYCEAPFIPMSINAIISAPFITPF